MAASEMDDIRDIPGYKIILRAVLKSQIQHLVETLASQTDEESVIITASLSEGTSTHLGSESGKNFLQDHEKVKTQFLGFCLKRLYEKNQEKEKEEKLKKTFSQQQSSESNSFPSPKEDVHPSRLSKASPVSRPPTVRHKPYTKPAPSRSSGKSSPGVHHEPYPIPQTHRSVNQTSPTTSQTSTSSPVTTHIKIEPLDFNLDQGDDEINKSVTSEPASPSSASVDPAFTDNLEENCDISVNNDTSKLPTYTRTRSLDSDFNDLISPELSVNPSTSSVQSSEVDPNVEVKVEAISECDMNLEIIEVTCCHDTNWTQDMSNIGFNTSNAAGNQADIQGGKGNRMGGAEQGIGGAKQGMDGAKQGIGGAQQGMDRAEQGIGGAQQGIGGAQQGMGTPQQGQHPIQGQDTTSNPGPDQLQNRNIIWKGQLEWQDKKPVPPAPSSRITRCLGCNVSIAMADQDINTSIWPTKLIMQLMPQTLLNSQQLRPLFRNSRQVMFHFHSNNIDHDHLENLYKVMGNGFAGCVHFPPQCCL